MERLSHFRISDKLKPLFYEIAQDIDKSVLKSKQLQVKDIQRRILELQNKESNLMNGFLENIISPDDYKKYKTEFSRKLQILQAEKQQLNSEKTKNYEHLIHEKFELLNSLSERYEQGNPHQKSQFLKKYQFELFVTTKKELIIKENKLFSQIISLNLNDGSATENRTPVYGMKTRSPAISVLLLSTCGRNFFVQISWAYYIFYSFFVNILKLF